MLRNALLKLWEFGVSVGLPLYATTGAKYPYGREKNSFRFKVRRIEQNTNIQWVRWFLSYFFSLSFH